MTAFDQIELVNEPFLILSSDMCFVHVSLLSMVTPNSLELEDHFMTCWLIFKLPKGLIKWLILRTIPLHFWGVVSGSSVCTRGWVLSRALFSVVVTWSSYSPTQYMEVSSAYRNVVAVLTTFGRSLGYKAKSMGPSTEPCGIACATMVFSEGTPLITVHCSGSDR